MPNQCGTNQCLPMQYSFILAVETCIDQCECQVYAKPQGGGFLNEYWSNSCSFSIGPSGIVLITGYIATHQPFYVLYHHHALSKTYVCTV